MKNKTIICYATIVAFLAVSAILWSCKKTESEDPKTVTCSSSNNEIDDYLKSFKKRLKESSKNDGDTMNIEDAEWHLSALLNFDFGDADHITNLFQKDTIKAKIRIENGQVEISQLRQLYDNAFQDVLLTYRSLNIPEKSVYSISCMFSEACKDGEADVSIVLTTRGLEQPMFKLSIDSTDNWLSPNHSSRCDGTSPGIGAPEILRAVLNTNRGDFGCVQGRVYFLNIGGCGFTDANSWPDPSSSSGYRMFFDSINSSVCIPCNEMNYYYQQMCSILSSVVPDGYVWKECGIDCRGLDPIGYGFRLFYCYDKINCTVEPNVE